MDLEGFCLNFINSWVKKDAGVESIPKKAKISKFGAFLVRKFSLVSWAKIKKKNEEQLLIKISGKRKSP